MALFRFTLFAQKYCFKGIWDGAGKVIKAFIRDSEVSLAQRFPDALACFIRCKDALKVLKGRKDWEKLETELDPKILHKATFATSKRFFGFATDDREQYEELRKVHEHIVFTDREKVPPIPRLEGTHKLHSVVGDPSLVVRRRTATFKLTTQAFPCDCFLCRKIITVASNTLQKNKYLQCVKKRLHPEYTGRIRFHSVYKAFAR
jgi:hypothetical protein